jgi:hypothetical protein
MAPQYAVIANTRALNICSFRLNIFVQNFTTDAAQNITSA